MLFELCSLTFDGSPGRFGNRPRSKIKVQSSLLNHEDTCSNEAGREQRRDSAD
jgi:hypothetical protein